jgi:hypothetical protein
VRSSIDAWNGSPFQLPQQKVLIELDVLRRLARSVDDAWNAACDAQAAARDRSLVGARECSDFYLHKTLQTSVKC